ncbi:hypothetical protein [Afipia sp. GAS231]|uniref:hypothetical protein n=1 Tax=Afipia sp. GAS231 TaxID=1882747 RepID=UPI00087C4965|nr:hypothetical protein [Afipia sp. GAS231]SDO67273.1 hypothetical protein SAMN05444050_4715 [Afipia sp. GAS231]
MNFQVTVLKILASYPDGFAPMTNLKHDMAILATSGQDWAERTRRLALRVPDLDIFSQTLIERLNGGWRITEKGRAVLTIMEARPGDPQPTTGISQLDFTWPAAPLLRRPSAAPLRQRRTPPASPHRQGASSRTALSIRCSPKISTADS